MNFYEEEMNIHILAMTSLTCPSLHSCIRGGGGAQRSFGGVLTSLKGKGGMVLEISEGRKGDCQFFWMLPKDLFKRKGSLAKSYFKQNYCHVCHTRFAVFFPLPSCCVSSLMRSQNGGDLLELVW